MHNRISLKHLIATTSLFCLAIGANVAPAAAAPPPAPTHVALAAAAPGPAPTCVVARTHSVHLVLKELSLTNNCNAPVRARVLLQFHADGSCVRLSAHTSRKWILSRQARVTGVVRC